MIKNILKKKNNTSNWGKQTPDSIMADLRRGIALLCPEYKNFRYKRTTVGAITEIEVNIKIYKRELYFKFIKIGIQGHITFGLI